MACMCAAGVRKRRRWWDRDRGRKGGRVRGWKRGGKGKDEELGNDEERRCREVDTGQLDPRGSLSIRSSAFWDLESLEEKRNRHELSMKSQTNQDIF